MKCAIYGGSFDPVHVGHEAVIKEALKQLDIDKIFVVPTFLNPFKSDFFAPPHLRLKWLNDLFKDNKKVEISNFETSQNRAVPTIESVHHFKNSYDEIYLIIGADNLKSLHKWKSFEELNTLVTWVVATRDQIEIDTKFKTLKVEKNISSSLLRNEPKKEMLPEEISDEIIKYYKEKNGRDKIES